MGTGGKAGAATAAVTNSSTRPTQPVRATGWGDRFSLIVATFFGAGLAPVASGTVGTVAALPLVWLVSLLSGPLQIVVAVGVTVLAMVAAQRAGRLYGVVDSGRIVIDEVAGILVTMLLVPFTPMTVVVGFLLFRLFDITKPWPVSFFDRKVKNGAGVVLDDVVAGLFARGFIALLMAWFPQAFGAG